LIEVSTKFYVAVVIFLLYISSAFQIVKSLLTPENKIHLSSKQKITMGVNMTLKNETYQDLKHRIITNNLNAGQQLFEKELMQAYGIGRTPLREIFFELQRDGLIEILPKLGTKVVSMDLKMLRETVQLRRELEGLAAELAAHHITAEQLDQFRQLLSDAENLDNSAPEALIRMSEIDAQIHQIIYLAAGNEQLVQIIKVLLDKMTMYWFQVGFSAGEFQEQFEELELLYNAMVKGDAAESRNIMRHHINHFAELIRKHIF
jgi:GntR family transcriptional regulator, rspAB operon transcriptional repressor